jgi:outer membrane protein OmpA-like peptidoglycan-associated protein
LHHRHRDRVFSSKKRLRVAADFDRPQQVVNKKDDGQMVRTIAASGLLLVLAACGQDAGYEVNGGAFGSAATDNAMIMSGEKQYTIDLGRRFAAEVPSTINFAFNSAQLDAQARTILDAQANWIRQFPELRFRVYGHTDAVGSPDFNKRLGLRRANAVVAYFSARGISRSRLEAVVSFGETKPVIPTPDAERQNRRTVTEVNGFVKSHPMIMDGKYAQVVYREYVESATAKTGLSTREKSSAAQ